MADCGGLLKLELDPDGDQLKVAGPLMEPGLEGLAAVLLLRLIHSRGRRPGREVHLVS